MFSLFLATSSRSTSLTYVLRTIKLSYMILSRNTQEYAAGDVEQGWEWVVGDKANIKCRKQEGDSGYGRGWKEVRRDGVRIRKSIVLCNYVP